MEIEAVDVEGAIKTYLTAYSGLTGTGNPVAGGFHLTHPKLPSTGAIAELRVTTPRTIDDISDTGRLQIYVRATGKAARETAEYGCRQTALALLALSGPQAIVQTRRGDWVRILVAGNSSGPSLAGDLGGEIVYEFDLDVRCQVSARPYGDGLYGDGIYGG